MINAMRILRARSVSSETIVTKNNVDASDVGRQGCGDTHETETFSDMNETPDEGKLDTQETAQESDGLSDITRETKNEVSIRKEPENRILDHAKKTVGPSDIASIHSMSCDGSQHKKRDTADMTSVKRPHNASRCDGKDDLIAACCSSLCCAGCRSNCRTKQSSVYSACQAKVLKVVEHKLFDGFILGVIIVSSILMVSK